MCSLLGQALSTSSAYRLRSLGVTTSPSAVRRQSNPRFHNRLWIADLAPMPVFDRPYFLCVVLDGYSRRCHGWNFSGRLDPDLIGGAVSAAVRHCWPAPFRPWLAPAGRPGLARRVVAPPGCGRGRAAPLANLAATATADFFRWLDADLISSTGWPNRERAKAAIEDWIVSYYNPAVSSPLIPDWSSGHQAAHLRARDDRPERL